MLPSEHATVKARSAGVDADYHAACSLLHRWYWTMVDQAAAAFLATHPVPRRAELEESMHGSSYWIDPERAALAWPQCSLAAREVAAIAAMTGDVADLGDVGFGPSCDMLAIAFTHDVASLITFAPEAV